MFGSVQWAAAESVKRRPARITLAPGDGASDLSVDVRRARPPAHPAALGGAIRAEWEASFNYFSTPPGTLSSLSITPHVPNDVIAGTVLHFSIDLTNPLDTAVPLTDCPTYTAVAQSFANGAVIGTKSRLNCAAAPDSIRPSETIRLEFQLDTTDLKAGGAVLTWTLGYGNVADLSAAPINLVLKR